MIEVERDGGEIVTIRSLETIRRLLDRGDITEETPVRNQGEGDFIRACDHNEIASVARSLGKPFKIPGLARPTDQKVAQADPPDISARDPDVRPNDVTSTPTSQQKSSVPPVQRPTLAPQSPWVNPNHPNLAVAEEASSPAPGSARPLRLLGEDVHTLDELATLIERRWKDMDRALGDAGDELRKWLVNQLGKPDLATRIEVIRRTSSGKSTPEIQLFRIHREIAPSRPPVFRDQPLTDLAIAKLAGRVASDPAAAKMITDLHDSDILLIQGMVLGHETLGRIGRAWTDALVAYDSLRATIGGTALPALTAARRTQLIAAATPGGKAVTELREQAGAVADVQTRRLCSWYAKLGDPLKADAPNLMAQVLGADAANAAMAGLLEERSVRAGSVALNAFIGALTGGGIAGGMWWILNEFCTDNCVTLHWHEALRPTEQILAFGAMGLAAVMPAVILTALRKGGR